MANPFTQWLLALFGRKEPEPECHGCLTMLIRDRMQSMGVREFEALLDRLPDEKQ